MEEEKKQAKQKGGFREGSGRKPKDGVGTKVIHVRLNKDHAAIIETYFESMTEFVCMAVKEKLKREGFL